MRGGNCPNPALVATFIDSERAIDVSMTFSQSQALATS
jgi:hypothetical protein